MTRLRADSDWVTKSVELKVPKGATRLNIRPAMFSCTGVFEIADLTVIPHLVARSQLADAVLPAGIDLDWDKTSVKTVDGTEARNVSGDQGGFQQCLVAVLEL
jgi:hypothetical protein